MADRTRIEWTDASWNPIRARNRATGGVGHYCARVSDGCRNCYAERMQPRFGNPIRYAAQDIDKVELFLDEAELLKPLSWKRPRMIFVCSMTDLFADFVPDAWLDRMFGVMALCPQHTFQVLTKRAERMRAYLSEGRPHWIARRILDLVIAQKARVVEPWPVKSLGDDIDAPDDVALHRWPLPNVWKGISVEDQPAADERIPILLDTPAALRWISAEPLLGPVDLRRWMPRAGGAVYDAAGGQMDYIEPEPGLSWAVAGGESGPGARPMHPDWARSLRDQCAAAGVPFLFKQWGEWAQSSSVDPMVDLRGRTYAVDEHGVAHQRLAQGGRERSMARVGKKAAGRLLDGVLHDGFPEVRR